MLVNPYLWDEGAEGGGGVVTWTLGSDEEIAAMIAAADNGDIDLGDYWSVGDERIVALAAMNGNYSGGFSNSQLSQIVVFVLMDTGDNSGYKDVNNNTVNYVLGQKNCLLKPGRMNYSDTNNGSWPNCGMRTDLNNIYYNALPETFKNCLKQFKVTTGYYASTNVTSNDYISLFAEKEVSGSRNSSTNDEANALTQIEYYKTATNKIKQMSGSNAAWWFRSPIRSNGSAFVASNGSAQASTELGIAPFGCI